MNNVTTATGGDWNSSSSWTGGLAPGSNGCVEVASGATLNITGNVSVKKLTVASGAVLNLNSNTLTVADGGSIDNSGTVSAAEGNVVFSGSATVSGNITYNNVSASGRVVLGSAPVINGSLVINAGGSIAGVQGAAIPQYGSGSVLTYNT